MPAGWSVRRFDRDNAPQTECGPGPRVILDNLRSAFNVGSIFRTCEAAGVAHLYLCGITATPENPKVQKTSLGAEHALPWSHHISTLEVVEELRREKTTIIAVELTNRSVPYTSVEYPERSALLFGHEMAGVPVPLLDRSDVVIEIPMLGRKNSLNVATSVGVVLFEMVRQRLPKASREAPGC